MRLSALAFICFVLFSATSVIAQEGPLCAPRDRIAELMRSTFGEVLMAQAVIYHRESGEIERHVVRP